VGKHSITARTFGRRFVRKYFNRPNMPEWINILSDMAKDDLGKYNDKKSKPGAPDCRRKQWKE